MICEGAIVAKDTVKPLRKSTNFSVNIEGSYVRGHIFADILRNSSLGTKGVAAKVTAPTQIPRNLPPQSVH
jgi:hypothetical protein